MGLFCARDEESKRKRVSLPPGARERAVQNAYGQKSMSGLLTPCARRWLTGEDVTTVEGGEGESEGGRWRRVYMVGWGSEHGRNRRRCPKRERVKRERTNAPSARATPESGTYDFIDCLLLMISVFGSIG